MSARAQVARVATNGAAPSNPVNCRLVMFIARDLARSPTPAISHPCDASVIDVNQIAHARRHIDERAYFTLTVTPCTGTFLLLNVLMRATNDVPAAQFTSAVSAILRPFRPKALTADNDAALH